MLKLKGGCKRNTALLNGMILIQADITYFNGVPLMTMEDDHSRNGWATSMIDQTDERVVHAMKTLHPDKYENLLTDNGSQFSRKNFRIKD
jgi:transposase InsO family protein